MITLRLAYLKHEVNTMKYLYCIISLAALTGCLAAQASAQSGAAREVFGENKEFRTATARAEKSIERYAEQLDKTDKALNKLSRSDSKLQERYKAFSGGLKDLEKAQVKAADDIQKMMAAATDYFAEWDKANMLISDPDLRTDSFRRRSQMFGMYERFASVISGSANDLGPMMTSLRDLNTFFGANITQETVESASKQIQACRDQAQELRDRIDDVRQKLGQLLDEAK